MTHAYLEQSNAEGEDTTDRLVVPYDESRVVHCAYEMGVGGNESGSRRGR